MQDLWIYLDRLFYLITGINYNLPNDEYDKYFKMLLQNALAEFQNVFSFYSNTLDELNKNNSADFLRKTLNDSDFEQKLILVSCIWFFSFYIAFIRTNTVKSTSLILIFTFFVYLGIAGTYKEKILKNFEFLYSFSYIQQVPYLISFARMINFPVILLSFSICIAFGYVYKLFRILLFVLVILRVKALFFSDSLAMESYIVLFFVNIILLYLLSKLLRVVETTAISLLFSSIGCFSMISHLMVFPGLKLNIKKFTNAIILSSNSDILRNPVFLTWLVLFAYSVRVTFIPINSTKRT